MELVQYKNINSLMHRMNNNIKNIINSSTHYKEYVLKYILNAASDWASSLVTLVSLHGNVFRFWCQHNTYFSENMEGCQIV
jgi:hypothetical protein